MPITLKTMSMKYRERPSDDWSPAMVQAVAPLDPVKEMIGIVVDGKRPSQAVSAGQYVIVKNSTITGITDGLYTAKNALSTSADVSASDLNAEITNGVANDLKNSLKNSITWKYHGSELLSANASVNLGEDFTEVMLGDIFHLVFAENAYASASSLFVNNSHFWGRYCEASKSGTSFTVTSLLWNDLGGTVTERSATYDIYYK